MKKNPIVKTCEDTSKSCLVNLEHAGVREAVELNKYLGFTSPKIMASADRASAVFQEIRYRFINYYIRKSGYKNILDIGCGYSPRTLEFLPDGYKYVGIELDEVVEKVTKAQKQCLKEEAFKNTTYVSVKLTDIEGIENAAKDFDGPVCIVIEGVFMYFTPQDLDRTLVAFSHILKKNGGCIITPDFVSNRMMKSAFIPFAGPILGKIMLKASYQVVKHYTQRTQDPYMDPVRQFADDSDVHAVDFFEKRGFVVAKVPLYVPEMEMTSFKTTDKKTEQAKREFSDINGWIAEVREDV